MACGLLYITGIQGYPVTDVIGVTSSTSTSLKDNHQRWQPRQTKRSRFQDLSLILLRPFCLGMIWSSFSRLGRSVRSKQINTWLLSISLEWGTVRRPSYRRRDRRKEATVFRNLNKSSNQQLCIIAVQIQLSVMYMVTDQMNYTENKKLMALPFSDLWNQNHQSWSPVVLGKESFCTNIPRESFAESELSFTGRP